MNATVPNLFELNDESTITFGIKDFIKKQIERVTKTFQCARTVIDTEVKGTNFTQIYEEFKMTVDNIIKNDLKKCVAMKSLEEQFL